MYSLILYKYFSQIIIKNICAKFHKKLRHYQEFEKKYPKWTPEEGACCEKNCYCSDKQINTKKICTKFYEKGLKGAQEIDENLPKWAQEYLNGINNFH